MFGVVQSENRVAKAVKQTAWEEMKKPPINSSLQVNELRKSMRRKLYTPENEWSENKLTTKSYVSFYTQPNIHYLPRHSTAPPGSVHPEKIRRDPHTVIMRKGQPKHWSHWRKEEMFYGPRGSAPIFHTFHFFCIHGDVLCSFKAPATVCWKDPIFFNPE